MSPALRFFRLVSICISIFIGKEVSAQLTIRGTVYNMYRTRPLDGVSVTSSFGKGTSTDSNGHYVITLDIDDSISFSYLGRTTASYPVRSINSITGFDIALHVNPTELNEVRVAPRNYHMDSLANRREYERVFDYKKPGLSLTSPSQGLGVGIDLDQLINMFRFQRNRRLASFQRRLLDEEEDKFIEHRFTRSLVKKITDLNDDQIDSFMVKYKPSYPFTKTSSDYEFYDYIKLASDQYKKEILNKSDMLKPKHTPL